MWILPSISVLYPPKEDLIDLLPPIISLCPISAPRGSHWMVVVASGGRYKSLLAGLAPFHTNINSIIITEPQQIFIESLTYLWTIMVWWMVGPSRRRSASHYFKRKGWKITSTLFGSVIKYEPFCHLHLVKFTWSSLKKIIMKILFRKLDNNIIQYTLYNLPLDYWKGYTAFRWKRQQYKHSH